MYNFEYHRPSSVGDAVRLLSLRPSAKLLAGGQTLIPTMKQRLAQPSDLIDLARVPHLDGIRLNGKRITIGAMAKHAEVAESTDVARVVPALARLAGKIGDAQVRNRGTLGGSIANADPAADYPAAVVGLAAAVRTNKREIPADDFFQGLFATALDADEIVVSVSFPLPEKAAYAKMPHPASRFAVVGVFVAKTANGARVAVTGAGPSVFRVKAMETALDRKFAPGSLDGIGVPADDLNEDLHASREYRAHLIPILARRAVAGCA
jgi:carbon-monoxide dehydrogenase medium subunit